MFWKLKANETITGSGKSGGRANAFSPEGGEGKTVPGYSVVSTGNAEGGGRGSGKLQVDLDNPDDVMKALRALGKIVGRRGGRPRKSPRPPAEAAAAASTAPPPPAQNPAG